MKSLTTGVVAALLATTVLIPTLPLPAHAAQSYDNCTGFIDTLPATISTQGTWCLRHDLSTGVASGNAIMVTTNNVTIDCNDFKLGGLSAGAGTATNGIYASIRHNITVRHCNIRGFLYGVALNGGGGHVVEDNILDGNTYAGIYTSGAGSTIRGNRVIDTGGSTSSTGEAYGIYTVYSVDVLDNTVNGVAPLAGGGGNASAYGILTNFNGEGSVTGNRIRGMTSIGAGTTYGIWNTNSGRLIARDNDIQGLGTTGSVGLRCFTNEATARDNVITGFETGVANCLSASSTVNAN